MEEQEQATSLDAPWEHVVKVKDDREPRMLTLGADPSGDVILIDGGTQYKPTQMRKEIEPWLTALCQSEHLSLLLGSGITCAADVLASGRSAVTTEKVELAVFEDEINEGAIVAAARAGRGQPNIEDQIRVIDNLIGGLHIYVPESANFRGSGVLKRRLAILEKEFRRILREFASAILAQEQRIASSTSNEAFNALVSFLLSFASRSGTRQRLHVFTTNYDRVIEFGAELAGLRLLDRFVGNLCPIFRASRLDIDFHYNPPGIRGEPRYVEGVAHFTKLHGSLDWVCSGGHVRRLALPFGADRLAESALKKDEDIRSLLIYPNAAKDWETAEYPYVELFRDFAAAICRPNSSLVVYGYSFGDDHINRILEDMLTIPSTHIVIIAYDDTSSRIRRFYERLGRPAQFTLLVGNHFGDLTNLVNLYLPKPAIDRTRIRMADLLKARGIEASADNTQKSDPEEPAEETL